MCHLPGLGRGVLAFCGEAADFRADLKDLSGERRTDPARETADTAPSHPGAAPFILEIRLNIFDMGAVVSEAVDSGSGSEHMKISGTAAAGVREAFVEVVVL